MKTLNWIIDVLREFRDMMDNAAAWNRLLGAKTYKEVLLHMPWQQEEMVKNEVKGKKVEAE